QYGQEPRITSEQMVEFLQICLGRAGADSMITPREMLRDYMTVLNILMQNSNATFEEVVGSAVTLKTAYGEEEPPAEESTSSSPVVPQKTFSIDEIEF
ncbi:MAG: DUF2791 family P-loop domain-containing protein, partial [Clostridia bacterium]|nr:DUF2791 family P-loop domain-containing protein [Clostridia bacterium]